MVGRPVGEVKVFLGDDPAGRRPFTTSGSRASRAELPIPHVRHKAAETKQGAFSIFRSAVCRTCPRQIAATGLCNGTDKMVRAALADSKRSAVTQK